MVLLVLDELDALMTTDQGMLVDLFRLPQVGHGCYSPAKKHVGQHRCTALAGAWSRLRRP